ncbi:hypothetical protein B0H19DRAFT_1275721 [Mycena capillaripes]|nr:hypothetical protein B0H19DRAFT_1275721 [Mycena capillaripes]
MKISQKDRIAAAAAVASPSLHLLPGPSVPHHRKKIPVHIARRPEVLLPNGETLIQLCTAAVGRLCATSTSSDTPQAPMSERDPAMEEFSASDDPNIMPVHNSPPPDPRQHRRKRASQWMRWQRDTLPRLLPHLARVLQETKSLRDLDRQRPTQLSCHCRRKLHKVAVVHFCSIKDVELYICDCARVPVQLMEIGVFGCAPVMPTLAVDLRVLEFTMNLFLQISPNNTAFTITLECVLVNMGFQLNHQNSLRRGSSSSSCGADATISLAFCPFLLPMAYSRAVGKKYTLLFVGHPYPALPDPHQPPPPAFPQLYLGYTNSWKPQTQKGAIAGAAPKPYARTPASHAPSECKFPSIVQCHPIDKNLIERMYTYASTPALRRRKTSLLAIPPRFHPTTHFVPEDVAAKMEAYVDSVRTRSDKTERVRKRAPGMHRVEEEEEDGYEHEKLLLPCFVLDGCEAFFTAVDEKHQKASTEFFEDTALMGLVCRHDRVLFVVNMHSAGEKQFPVILLMETVFSHLLPHIRVGLLYDIACTLERSCLKWGFLARWLDRIAFAVSRAGFGFTNSEGCERFWHSIQHLIAHLRICGYHNCLYTLDAQMEHNTDASLLRLGDWIRRRHIHSHGKRLEATMALRACGKSKELLCAEWKKQVMAQTKPLPRQSKKRGEQAVNAVLLLRTAVETRREQVRQQQQKFLASVDDDDQLAILYEWEFQAGKEALRKAEVNLRRKEEALGVTETQALKELVASEYMRLCMNARALKLKLRNRLRARKMGSAGRAAGDDDADHDPEEKLRTHTASAVQHREPTISKVAANYNKLCAQIQKLIVDGKAPQGSVVPLTIPSKGLWQLDVNDAIFQDVGLDDNNNNEPALWLSDDNVRTGIKAMLELDRCNEKDAQLRRERMIATRAVEAATLEVDKYHLQLHQDKLVKLCATWDKDIPELGVDTVFLPPWVPSMLRLLGCKVDAHVAARGEDRHYGEDGGDLGDDEGENGEDGGEYMDFGTLEALERADIYRNNADN